MTGFFLETRNLRIRRKRRRFQSNRFCTTIRRTFNTIMQINARTTYQSNLNAGNRFSREHMPKKKTPDSISSLLTCFTSDSIYSKNLWHPEHSLKSVIIGTTDIVDLPINWREQILKQEYRYRVESTSTFHCVVWPGRCHRHKTLPRMRSNYRALRLHDIGMAEHSPKIRNREPLSVTRELDIASTSFLYPHSLGVRRQRRSFTSDRF